MKRIGSYRTIKTLGKGGNGIVYEVALGKDRFALKTLKDFSRTSSYARFSDEIAALKQLGPIPGVVTLLDAYIPENPRKQDLPYYTMPIGIPFEKKLAGKDDEHLFKAFLKIAKAVADLHEKGFTHRDIKPNNMMFIGEDPVITDFGLVSFPDKTPRSGNNEKIGPAWTIAPEMQRTSSTAEFKKADVYSMAKTLWILITRKPFGFEGQYIPKSNISLENFVELMINKMTNAGQFYYHSTVILDLLLKESTDNDPAKRPTAQEFHDLLELWLSSNDNFKVRNPFEWEDALNAIFPHGIPIHCEWTDPWQILKVLEVLTNYDNLNHFFFPTGGGDDMESIQYNEVSEIFILNGDDLIKIEKLIFKSLGNAEWSYFRIVIAETEPYTKKHEDGEEEYIADHNFQFAGLLYDEEGEINREVEGVQVRRFLKGSFIVVQKTSGINKLRGYYKGEFMDGYTKFHDKFSYDEYHEALGLVM
ncbi:protein kinase [Mucilaginibacter sp. cycad4]|uniref:serine/threonine protein kinase n=1 Tax=Mucilaginibacter sp. cycad4 TaxID=3342096 RepID=UPI002AAB324D|nr:protein kinase [Mucilaginibacter gossypii]WPU99061.1 protein kinase [Mucilaginibacter gossypii]